MQAKTMAVFLGAESVRENTIQIFPQNALAGVTYRDSSTIAVMG